MLLRHTGRRSDTGNEPEKPGSLLEKINDKGGIIVYRQTGRNEHKRHIRKVKTPENRKNFHKFVEINFIL